MMEASSSPQDVAGDPQMGVRVDPEDDDLELWERNGKHRTQQLTSLVLSDNGLLNATIDKMLEDSKKQENRNC